MKSFFWKLREEKGEVSVEWALVAVAMCLVIIAAYMPGVRDGLQTAIDNITTHLGTNTLPAAS